MTSITGKRSITNVVAAKLRRKRNFPKEEQQLPPDASSSTAHSDICTYWAADPQRVLLRRLFFLYANKTKLVSVGFYPARDYLPLMEFGAIRSCGSNAIILTDEQV